LFGLDVDPLAVAEARLRLARLALCVRGGRPDDGQEPMEVQRLADALAKNVRCGDALIGVDYPAAATRLAERAAAVRPFDWEAEFPSVLDGPTGGFDAVVANPPYLNIRRLTKNHGPAVTNYLRTAYRCAYRGYDAYVLFFERAFRLLRPSGRCGIIAPNKIATLDYARPCRSLLIQQTTIRQITDVSALKLFPGAGVYPYIFFWEKRPPGRLHEIAVVHARSGKDLTGRRVTLRVRQRDLSAETGFGLHGVLDVESRVATEPLGGRAQLHSGATGFTARRLAGELEEKGRQPLEGGFEFIVSGNIDRYHVRLGDVRFMHLKFLRPVLPAGAGVLSERKRRLYGGPKIVIAGVGRRLEAAWDHGGLALGVQVFAAAELDDEPYFLLALLNSRLLSYLFRIRFQAKRLGGGFLAVNKSQLEKLPIRTFDEQDRRGRSHRRQLAQLAARMQRLCLRRLAAQAPQAAAQLAGKIRAADRRIDRLVYQIYELTDAEIARVEAEVD
jgi:hypothetical protein